MSRPDVNPGATETQQMRVTAPAGVSFCQILSLTPRSIPLLVTDFYPFCFSFLGHAE